jgi:hypothetical protein
MHFPISITCSACGSPAWASLTLLTPAADRSGDDIYCHCCGWAVWSGTTVSAGIDLEPEEVEARVAALVTAAGRRVGRRRRYIDPWDRPTRIVLITIAAPGFEHRSSVR